MNKILNTLFYIIIVIGLFSCLTNFVYLSAVPSLVCVIFPFLIIQKGKIPTVTFWLLLFFSYAILSTLIYAPNSFLDFKFYRYDGNFIISYLPLLCIPLMKFDFDIDKLFTRLLYIVTAVNLILISYFLINSNFYLDADTNSFGSLFIARNAAGGFLSIICGLAFVHFLYKKTLGSILVFLLNFFFLVATFSRGSILGLLLGILAFYLIKKGIKYAIGAIFFGAIALQLIMIYYTYPIYEKLKSENEIFVKQEGITTKSANILIRLYWSWPSGVKCFLNSPIFGAGFGAVNDTPLQFSSANSFPLVSLNEQEDKKYNDAHAHHSYFHIIGELGLTGIFIFFMFWLSIYNFLIKADAYPYVRGFLLIAFFNITFASLTEHRLTTPSSILPFVLSLGLLYAKLNSENKKNV